jgi:hypothetical protein
VVHWILTELKLGSSKTPSPLSETLVAQMMQVLRQAVSKQRWPEEDWRTLTQKLAADGHPFPVEEFQWTIEDLISAFSDKNEVLSGDRLGNFLSEINNDYLLPQGWEMEIDLQTLRIGYIKTSPHASLLIPFLDEDTPDYKGSPEQMEAIQVLRRFLRRAFRHGHINPEQWAIVGQSLLKNTKYLDDLITMLNTSDRQDRGVIYAALYLFTSSLSTSFLPFGFLIDARPKQDDWDIVVIPVDPQKDQSFKPVGTDETTIHHGTSLESPILRYSFQTGLVIGDAALKARDEKRLTRYHDVPSDVNPWFQASYGKDPSLDEILKKDLNLKYMVGSLLSTAAHLGSDAELDKDHWEELVRQTSPQTPMEFIKFAERYVRPDSFLGLYYAAAPPERRAQAAENIAYVFALANTGALKTVHILLVGEIASRTLDAQPEPLTEFERLFLTALDYQNHRDQAVEVANRTQEDAPFLESFMQSVPEISSIDWPHWEDSVLRANFLCRVESEKDHFQIITQQPGSPAAMPEIIDKYLKAILTLLVNEKHFSGPFENLYDLMSRIYGDVGDSLRAQAAALMEPPPASQDDPQHRLRTGKIAKFIHDLNRYSFEHARHVIHDERASADKPAQVYVWPVMPGLSGIWSLAGETRTNDLLVADVDSRQWPHDDPFLTYPSEGFIFNNRFAAEQHVKRMTGIDELLASSTHGLTDRMIELIRYWHTIAMQPSDVPILFFSSIAHKIGLDLLLAGTLSRRGKLDAILDREGAKWKNTAFTPTWKIHLRAYVYGVLISLLNNRKAPPRDIAPALLGYLAEETSRLTLSWAAGMAVSLELLASVIPNALPFKFQLLDYDHNSYSKTHLPFIKQLARAASKLSEDDWEKIALDLLRDSFDRYLIIDPVNQHIDVRRLDTAA